MLRVVNFRLAQPNGAGVAGLAVAEELCHLVYPVPQKGNEGLGIHALLDIDGRVRFGPDREYVTDLDYT